MKNNKKKGFTLAELLVVVAIIAVLVAVSIPVFNAQLGKAKLATNQANARAAYAAATADYLMNGYNGDVYYRYNVNAGSCTVDGSGATTISGYTAITNTDIGSWSNDTTSGLTSAQYDNWELLISGGTVVSYYAWQ